MKNFKRKLTNLYKTLDGIFIFRNVLSTLIVFLVFYIVFMTANFFIPINQLWAIVPAGLYFAYTYYFDINKKMNNHKLSIVEKRYPEMNEKLRTAADNLYLENPVVEELQEEVTKDLKKVYASSFLDVRKNSVKILSIIILCLVIIGLAVLQFKLMDWGIITPKNPRIIMGSASPFDSETDDISASDAENVDLYGEESIGELGDEDAFISINSLSFELTNVRSEDEIPDDNFNDKFPDEIELLQECDEDCVHQNNIPLDQQELVKNYFINLAES